MPLNSIDRQRLATFVERTWFGVAPDGSEHDVRLRIGIPELRVGGEWSAEISLVPLEMTTRSIFGVDGWQALQLAQQFAATRVRHFIEEGWTLYWQRGGEAADPFDLANNAH